MKKVICLAILVLFLLPGVAIGAQVQAYEKDNGGWRLMSLTDRFEKARCWSHGGTTNGACNKEEWQIDVVINASVAQWIEWSITGTEWEWQVRKPGIYSADCIEANVKSNCDVNISFSGFDDLEYQGAGGVNRWIKIWYSAGLPDMPPPPGDASWVRAPDLNSRTFTLEDSEDLHSGELTWKLYNMIEVEPCNSCCNYQDLASIYLTLTVIKPWIDPSDGGFLD
jgi:hypothetical protein